MAKSSSVSLSVIVVSWNTVDLLRACLRSLYDDREAVCWQVIVVDNGSEDGSAAMVRREFPQVELIENEVNAGFVGGSNRGLQVAGGKFLLLLNPDTVVEPGALPALVRFMAGEPQAGAAGPMLLNRDSTLQLSCGRPPTFWSECTNKLLLHKLLPFFKLGRWKHDEVREVGWVTGAALLVRREVLEEVGPLDERLFMFYEDLDWCMRIRAAGWKIFYLPHSRIRHLGGQSTRQDLARMLVISQQSLFYLYGKHFHRRLAQPLRLLTAYEMVARAAAWSVHYLARRHRRSASGPRLRAYVQILTRCLSDRSYWSPAAPTDPAGAEQRGVKA